jgi:hypothetical protein
MAGIQVSALLLHEPTAQTQPNQTDQTTSADQPVKPTNQSSTANQTEPPKQQAKRSTEQPTNQPVI